MKDESGSVIAKSVLCAEAIFTFTFGDTCTCVTAGASVASHEPLAMTIEMLRG